MTAVALFKDTSDLKKGDLNYGNLFDIYKYPNVLYTVKVSGAEMKAYMDVGRRVLEPVERRGCIHLL